MSDPMQEIMASFFVECEELHEALVDAIQAMADGDRDSETINVAFRAVHSIKGGAGAFGLDELVGFAHQFETVMDRCRASSLALTNDLTGLFLRCADMLSDLIRAARDGTGSEPQVLEGLIAELAAYAAGAELPNVIAAPAPQQPTRSDASSGTGLIINFKPDRELYESGNEPLYLLRALEDLGECETSLTFDPPKGINEFGDMRGRLCWTVKIATDSPAAAVEEIFEFVIGLCQLEITDTAAAAGAASAVPRHNAKSADDPPTVALVEDTEAKPTPATKMSQTVRVDLDRIERLVNLVGELVINQSMLSQSIAAENIPPNSPVGSGLDEFMQLTRDIQESVMMIRAQPVKSLFQRMSRIVREASANVGKSVRLVTEGETTEIDKTAIDSLAEPLTHMIRNAVDHGLEAPATRLAIGKPEQGEIRLAAAHRSGRVVIEVSDDGGGINRDKVREKAQRKGLIPANAALDDAEVDQLLFLPGFSTADEVSALSGRGVGMDVVKTQIAALGGRVSIESTPGIGTKFSISLPLTLAVLDGMVVTVAGETLVVPLNAIIETLSLSESDLRPISPDAHVLCVREKFLPVIDLGHVLGYRDASNTDSAIALLISPEEGVLVAMLVDTIEDQRQVVIKGLQQSYGRVHGVAAATILGDGKVALILDASDIAQGATGAHFDIRKEAS